MLKTGWKDVKQVSLYEMVMVTCTCPRQKWETTCVSAPSLEEMPCLGAGSACQLKSVGWRIMSQWQASINQPPFFHRMQWSNFRIQSMLGLQPNNPSIQKDPNRSPLGVPSLILRWMGAKAGRIVSPFCSVARPCERPINAQGRWRFRWKVGSKCNSQNLGWYKL